MSKFTTYEEVKNQSTEDYFNNNQFSIDAFNKKYRIDDKETYVKSLKRVCDFIASVEETEEKRQYWSARWFHEIYNDWWHPAGSIMQGAGSNRNISASNCFSQDTEFITDKGVKSFADFNSGDKVNVLTNMGDFHQATVKNYGKQKLYQLTLQRNSFRKEIKCTLNHAWRVLNKTVVSLKETKDLVKDDVIPYIKRKSTISQTGSRYYCPLGFIHGLVYGDGTYYKDEDYCNLDLCGDSREYINFFKGFHWVARESEDRIRIAYLPNYMKRLPDFNSVNSEYILGFLIGWFAADGTVDSDGRAELSSANLESLQIIKNVIQSLGIYTSDIRMLRELSPFDGSYSPCYNLYFIKDCLFESFFTKTSHKNNYANYKNNLQNDKTKVQWKVVSLEETDLVEDVWCVEVPSVHNFTLADGVSTNNCTTISLGVNDINRNWDNLESIFKNTAYTVAKCAAFRQGLGVDFSRLRPKNTKVYNSANESTGAIHWMKFIDSIGYYVGQKGRIPAMLFSLNCSHPDVEEFITCKADYTKIQNANISVQCTDAFYEAVEKDKEWELSFEIPEVKKGQKVYVDVHSIDRDILKDNKGFYYLARQNRPYEKFTKKVSARKLLELIAKHMTLNAEPGIQNIDIARKYSNSDYLYDPTEEYDTRIISSNAPVVGDTLIPTVFGIKPIKELFEKETVEVISDTITALPANLIDHNNLKTTYGKYNFPTKTIPVTATFKKYEKQQVYEIHLNNGCVLKCNSEHKWLINGEMTKTVDIKIGDKLFKPNGGIYQAYNLKTDFNAPDFQLGDLVGYIVGDGWIGKESNLHNKMIGIVYDPDCTPYSESFRKLYNQITGKNLSGERDRGKIKEIRTEQVDFVKFFEQFGLINNKYVVPTQCYSNKEFCAGFLRGLFQADSHVRWNGKQGYINLTTVSPKIANGVRDLLSNWFGIHVTITKTKGVGVKYGNNKISNAKDKYDVRISIRNHMIRFRDLIGLIGDKGEKLKLIHNNCQQYNNRIASVVLEVIKSDKYEDMYCAVVPGLQSFVVNGYISSNCSEQYLSRESLCVLASINAGKFSVVEEEYKEELETIGESVNRFLDNVNECELRYGTYATPHQKLAIQQLRRTGAGYTNLVEWLFNQNRAYGSKDGNDVVENFTKWYNYYLYKSSIALGKEKGNFGAFDREKLEKSPFIQRMIGMGLKFTHLRNVTCSSIAPTGSLTLMFRYLLMSYGIEPAFDLYFWKRTRISGRYEYYFCVPNAVRRVFAKHGINLPINSDTVKDTWDGKIGRAVAKIIDENKAKLNLNFQKSTEVTCMDKLDLMAKAMKWIDSSISVTYLLPENANWKDVYDFILEANKREVKSIAAFPDKKMYGIVSFVPFKDLAFKLTAEGVDIHAQNFTDEELKELNISRENINVQNNAPKRLKSLSCDLHYITHNNENYLVVIGIQNGVPYEVFGGHIRSNSKLLQDKPKQGTIIRNGQANYSLELPNQRIDHFGSTFTPFEQTIFRLASTMMRHGVPIQYVVEQLSKAAQDIHSIENIIARVLKKYIKDGQKISGKECPSCKSTDLVYQEGCVTCAKCQWSKCS